VSRFLFFVLLLAVAALGAHIWLSAEANRTDLSVREYNADKVRVVSVTPPVVAARSAANLRRETQGLAGAACVLFSGIAPADFARAHDAFAAMNLGDRLAEQRVEDVTRYWVFMPPAADHHAAEQTMAGLKRLGIGDLSVRPDDSISLGVFSREDAAQRFLASLRARGVRGAQVAPFAKELRDLSMLVREPDTELVARLTIVQRDFPGSKLRAVPCPATQAAETTQ